MILLILTLKGYSQEKADSINRNAIFFEMGGAGGSHSMNYERRFELNQMIDLSARGGFGFDNLVDYNGIFNPDIVIPVMLGMMCGENHKLELGVGQTFSNLIETDIDTGEPARMSNFSTTFNIGYRYENPRKNILIRAGYTPYIEFNETYKHWAGVSIGFLF